jgi:threonine/homoserine/homoserine lactone efflux protein
MADVTLTTAVVGFAVVAAALTVTPGLDTALVLRAALTGRRRDALATGLGIVVGLFVWAGAAAVGISALLTASAVAFDVLRYVGAAYLVGVGGRLLWRALRARPAVPVGGDAVPSPSPWRAARVGLLTNLLNPKVGVFYVALLPQFVPAGTDPVTTGLLLAAVHAALSSAWFALLTLLAGALAPVLRRPRTVRIIDGTTGAALIGFGLGLATLGR